MNRQRYQISDADLLRALRNLEASGIIWSAIDKDGQLRYYLASRRRKPANPDKTNVTSLSNAARRRHRAD